MKSQNVLLDGGLRAKLADFGLAVVEATVASSTVAHHAPRSASGKKVRSIDILPDLNIS